jgi:imidazolonepropionase-like amidohydrolase
MKAWMFCLATLLLALCGHAGATEGDAPQPALLLRNVTTLGLSALEPVVTPGNAVLIRKGRIAALGSPALAAAGDEATVVDATGMTLLPGLQDLHVHLWDEAELGAYLAHGVTTIRNLSGMPFHLDLAARIHRGELAGPRLLTSGPILNSRGPNLQLNHQVVEDAKSAREAVHWQYQAGFRRLKVYSNLSREAYEAALDAAHSLGMAVTGHPPEGRRGAGVPEDRPFAIAFSEILDDGFETLEHVESIAWHALRGRQDLAGAQSLARDLAASGVPVTATLVAHHNLYRAASEGRAFLDRPGTEWLNPVIRAAEAPVYDAWLGADAAATLRADRFYGEVARLFDEAGVLLVAGSDAGIFANSPGDSLVDELTRLVAAGISPYRALRSATHNAAMALAEDDRGCVVEGCLADLVLYPCNPLEDLACLRRPQAVIRNGRLFDSAALEALRARAARHDVERTLRNLRQGLRAQGSDPAILDALQAAGG